MSWFSEFAGKAEDLLNRVDQTAATALQKKKQTSSAQSSPYKSRPDSTSFLASESLTRSTPPTQEFRSSLNPVLPNRRLSNPSTSSLRKKPESDDEKLFQFLNNSEALPSPARKARAMPEAHKRKDSGLPTDFEVPITPESSTTSSTSTTETVDPGSIQALEDIEMASNRTTPDGSGSSESFEVVDGPPVKILSAEEEILMQKRKLEEAEIEIKRLKKKSELITSQLSGGDKIAQEFKEREWDMAAALDSKDGQLAILKVRLEEADRELNIKKKIVEDLKAENDKLIREHAQSSAQKNKSLEMLQEQLEQKENEFSKVTNTMVNSEHKFLEELSKVEQKHKLLVENYSSLQKKWTEANDKNKDLTNQLKLYSGNLEAMQQEYNDYKQKAQRILQSKEKLICSLKEGNINSDSIEKSEAASLLLSAEMETANQERELLREELRRTNELAEAYRVEIQELEKMSQNESVISYEKCNNLNELLSTEKMQKDELQLLNGQLKEELQVLREDFVRTKSSFQSRVQDREIEIEKLRRQLTAKSLSTVSQDELESRLHALTENLIQKQTLVEALSTEKNSLVLQLERLDQQLRDAQNYSFPPHSFVGIANHEQDRKPKAVFLDNPFDSSLTRRVKRVYGTIDAFSIRLGVFFRRYPIARVFVIVYMLLLHFWVMIVLLTYEPEVHGPSYEQKKI